MYILYVKVFCSKKLHKLENNQSSLIFSIHHFLFLQVFIFSFVRSTSVFIMLFFIYLQLYYYSFRMQQLVENRTRSVILTSGTLSPLKPYISEIGIPIGVTLENPHIVKGDQLCVGILSKGPDSHQLNSSYNTRFIVTNICDIMYCKCCFGHSVCRTCLQQFYHKFQFGIEI